MTLEYAPSGLVGMLMPQANTTVEPVQHSLATRAWRWLMRG